MTKMFDEKGQIVSSPYVVDPETERQQNLIPRKQNQFEGNADLTTPDHFLNAGAGNFFNPLASHSMFFKLF